MKKQGTVSLLFCVVMDLVGYATYTIPFLGEFGDLLWAPISAIVFYKTFGSWKGSVFNFLEEALPFTDFIPSFTLMWVFKKGFRNNPIGTNTVVSS